jgi:hypothetical protein
MKLLIDAINIRSGGGYSHLENILCDDFFTQKFEEVIIFTSSKTKQKLLSIRPALRIHSYFFFSAGLLNYILSFLYTQLFFTLRYRNYILFSPGGNFYFRSYITMHRNLLPFVKQEILVQNIVLKFKMILLRRYLKIVYRRADKVVFLNTACRDIVQFAVNRVFNADNSIVVGHPVRDIVNNKERIIVSPQQINFTYVGDFLEYKNHRYLIILLNQWSKTYKKKCFVNFVGIDDKNKSDFIELLRMAEFNFRVLGKLDKSSYNLILDNTDISLMVSRVESYSQIVSESIARDIPVLALDVSTYRSSFGSCIYYFSGVVDDFELNIVKIMNGCNQDYLSNRKFFISNN